MRAFVAYLIKLFRATERSLIPLDERSIDPDPIRQFQRWYDDAVKAKFYLAEAMTLATATNNGTPSARMVLMKKADAQGFVFFTNYNSRKSIELLENPKASLLFHWPEMHCQVRIEGTIERVSEKESDDYFHSRTRESQIAAISSPQSEVIHTREELDRTYDELTKQYEGKPIPRPQHWGGFRLKPQSMEFWQGRAHRLHDRILYELQKDGSWAIKRLAP